MTVKCTCKDSSLLFVFVMCQESWSVEELQSVSDVVRECSLCWLIVVWHSLNRDRLVLGRGLRAGPQRLCVILFESSVQYSDPAVPYMMTECLI